jgi:hypothetical protein
MTSRLGAAIVLALALGLTLAVGPGASPAAAVPAAPTVSNLDASTPGHVTGTVASDQPFVLVRLAKYVSWMAVPWTVVPVSGDRGTFDLETWGYGPGQTVQAVACSQSTYTATACSAAQTDGVQFTPTDVIPTITWPADTTVGPGQTATISVSDPNGGGSLQAESTRYAYMPAVTPLLRNGTTQLNLLEGGDTLRLRRCSTVNPGVCTNFIPDQSISLSVRTVAHATLGGWAIITGTEPVVHPTVQTDSVGTYSLEWHLERDGVPVPGHGATVTGTLGTYGQSEPLPVSGSGLPDGEYVLVTAITVNNPSYGTFPAAASSLPITVDMDPPPVSAITVSDPVIYPMAGNTPGHPPSATIVARGQFGPWDHFRVSNVKPSDPKIFYRVDATFNADRTEMRATLGGTAEGAVEPPWGNYAVSVVDGAGNAAPATVGVTVSGLRLVHRTDRMRFPATTKVAQYVGRCSTLRRLAPPQRSGALGYYANTRCARTGSRASSVSTEHRLKLPAAYRYTDLRVDVEGGAARSRPSSQALFRFRSSSRAWLPFVTLPSAYGLHTGATQDLTGLVRPDGVVNWGVSVRARNRYVVRRFIVTLHYDVLEEPLW